MKAVLLGLDHPHSRMLLISLQLLDEVTDIIIWGISQDIIDIWKPPADGAKVSMVTADLDTALTVPGLDFAVVAVRHDLMAGVCLRTIAAGCHLLSEKPVGLNAEEIKRVQGAATKAGVVASVLYGRRYHPCVQRARDLLRSGTMGKLRSIECRFLTTQVRYRQPDSWLFRRAQAGGGILLWLGCHCLDLMHHVTGDEIVAVSAMTATQCDESIDVEDTAMLNMRFASGAAGTFHTAYCLANRGEGYRNPAGYDSYLGFNTSEGRVIWPDLQPKLWLESPAVAGSSNPKIETFPVTPSPAYGGSHGLAFMRDFIKAIQGSASPPADLTDALRTARIIAAAYQSSETGRTVPL